MTDLELKQKLARAKELSELIQFVDNPLRDQYGFFWLSDGKKVTEQEWDWVMWKLVFELPSEVQEAMWHELFEGDEYDWNKTWQQRAEAYFKVKEQL